MSIALINVLYDILHAAVLYQSLYQQLYCCSLKLYFKSTVCFFTLHSKINPRVSQGNLNDSMINTSF